jgi:S1-C subfamily serine protease
VVTHQLIRILAVACAALAAVPALGAKRAGTERSVVRIVNFSQRGDWFSPWNVSKVVESSGSGFIIEGGLVLTNAHVVSDSRLLLLQAHNDPEPHVAEVLHVAHDCDLALIRPVEPGPLDAVPSLRFGGLPELGSTVDTLGYPAGGSQLSSTRGVVSRIEEQLYVHSGKDLHLTVQTDAAINPGNSGGPVVQEGRVVGVAFQANLDLESVGFFIPMEVIERFLRDVEDGRYDGYPELGVNTSSMENPAARAHAGLEDGESGVRVDSVYRGTSADERIREGDILLAVNGRPVANDGSVADGDFRIPFGLLVDRIQIGGRVSIRVLRDGSRLDLEIPLQGYPAAESRGHIYDRRPRYYVYGGLVFVALNRETLKTYGADWQYEADKGLLHDFFVRPAFEPELLLQERVVLLRRLTHPVNADMAWYRNEAVERVNGREITSLDVLVETLENHDGDYHFIEFANVRRFGVLDRRKAEDAHDEILERYGIEEDRNL